MSKENVGFSTEVSGTLCRIVSLSAAVESSSDTGTGNRPPDPFWMMLMAQARMKQAKK